jgi:hypothetical protein
MVEAFASRAVKLKKIDPVLEVATKQRQGKDFPEAKGTLVDI